MQKNGFGRCGPEFKGNTFLGEEIEMAATQPPLRTPGLPEAVRSREGALPVGPGGSMAPDTLISGQPVTQSLDSGFQNCEKRNFYCSKPISLW